MNLLQLLQAGLLGLARAFGVTANTLGEFATRIIGKFNIVTAGFAQRVAEFVLQTQEAADILAAGAPISNDIIPRVPGLQAPYRYVTLVRFEWTDAEGKVNTDYRTVNVDSLSIYSAAELRQEAARIGNEIVQQGLSPLAGRIPEEARLVDVEFRHIFRA